MSFFRLTRKLHIFIFLRALYISFLKHLIVQSDLYSSWAISLLEFTSILMLSLDPITESLIDCLEQRFGIIGDGISENSSLKYSVNVE